jgi:hypothetical protein
MSGYRGYYINLDRSRERRASIESELLKSGVRDRYERFPAVDGTALAPGRSPLTPAEIGCFLSHRAVMDLPHGDAPFIHLLEDKARLAAAFDTVVSRFIDTGALDAVDLVFTDVLLISPPASTLRKLWAALGEANAGSSLRFSLIELPGFPFASANSYLVNRRSIGKVRALLHRELGQANIPKVPVDLLYRREINAGRLKAVCIFPFVSDVVDTKTTMTDRASVSEIQRFYQHALYVDCDIEATQAALAAATPPDNGDKRLDILVGVHKALILRTDIVE